MLTFRDRVRLRAKDMEFYLPRSALNLVLSFNVLNNPFVDKDHEYKCVFIHVPKAAGTSLRRALYGTKSFHIPAVRYQAFDSECFDKYFKFCFVRNPWDRLLSAYEYLKKRCDSNMAYPDHRWAQSNLKKYASFHDFIISLEDAEVRRLIK